MKQPSTRLKLLIVVLTAELVVAAFNFIAPEYFTELTDALVPASVSLPLKPSPQSILPAVQSSPSGDTSALQKTEPQQMEAQASPNSPLRLKEADKASQDSVLQALNTGDLEKEAPIAPETLKFDRESILSDYDARISRVFQVDPQLRERVGFWFDVYTKYPSDQRIIHHQKFPWIVFKVVDVSPILYSTTPPRRWQRNMKADKVVAGEIQTLRKELSKIAHTSNFDKLSADELALVEILKKLPGKVQKNAAEATHSLRIQMGQKDFFSEGLQISSSYLPDMEKIFAASKIPTELTRLPLVESSFNHFATSKAGASGIWQFVGKTGRKFLIVNSSIDERRSPFKSTHAAALLLKENHQILFRSWPLAITAYNHGPAGVRKAAKVVGSHDIAAIIRRYNTKTFNFASSNYYSEFLGALYAEKYKDKIFGEMNAGLVFNDDSLSLPRSMRARQILQITGMTADELVQHNPDLARAVTLNAEVPRGFKLHVPAGKRENVKYRFAIIGRTGRLNAWNG
jgi:membrane-bound lytic murein transglycosylase D